MVHYIDRKFYEPGGFAYHFTGGKCKPLAPNVAYLTRGHRNEMVAVTWDEVMADRRKRQTERLQQIRQECRPTVLPCYVWAFFNRQDIPYHGWYCYVVTRQFEIAVNFRGFRSELALSIMSAIPLGLFPMEENFEAWMEAFAKKHPRPKTKNDPRKAGTCVGWLSNERRFTLERPLTTEEPTT